MNKYEWYATNSGPKGYPVQIIKGSFIYPEDGGLYIPDISTLDAGWGFGHSNHLSGSKLKPLPNRMSILFFSYTENKFYQGEFDLPYDTICRLFKEGFYSYKEDEQLTYSRIMAGVAPGGTVSVWLDGMDKTIEVFFGEAEEVDAPWELVTSDTDTPREEYVNFVLKGSSRTENTDDIEKNGIPFDKWSNFRRHYNWHPKMVSKDNVPDPFVISEITYFNGERNLAFYPLNKEEMAKTRPVPSEMFVTWKEAKDKPASISLEFLFDEKEIMQTFKTLSEAKDDNDLGKPLQLQLYIQKRKNGSWYPTAYLSSQKETILLEKTVIERW